MARILLMTGAAVSILGLSGRAALADEGLWTFDNFPAAAVKAKYGVTIDQAWLDSVEHAAVGLSTGCSASVVSPEGLVLTNHHCISDCAQALSTPQQDYIKSGFIAAARRNEQLCPGVQAEILTSIADVTDHINGAVAGKSGPEFVKSSDAAITAIEEEGCNGKGPIQRCEVVTLYQGGQYKVYTYRKYSDVRLVFAPERATAFFGGDPDNFNFSRYTLEFAFVRLYENGHPVKTPEYLRWNASAPADGEPVFAAGNPGSTQRLSTAEQVSFLRNTQLPQTVARYSELRGRLIRFGEEGPEQPRVANDELFEIENTYKARSGRLQALNEPGFIEVKHEADLAGNRNNPLARYVAFVSVAITWCTTWVPIKLSRPLPSPAALLAGLLAALFVPLACAASGTPFTVEDLVILKRVSDPQIAADGHHVAYVQRETDLEADRGRTSLWLLDSAHPGASQRLTDGKANDSSPRWAPDGRALYFISDRSGSAQVWRLALGAGEARRITDYPLKIGSLKVSPAGDALALSMEVFTDCADLACTRARLDALAKAKATGRLYDRLFVRHWDTWSDGTRSHLFSVRLGADGAAGTPVDVSRGLDADIPGKPFGGAECYAFSPDGKSLVFSARIAGRTEPWSTNFDLFQASVDGAGSPVNLTAANPAWDAWPVFLPNGDLAWLAQDRPGFESDRFHVMLKSAASGAMRSLTAAWDRSVSHLAAATDGRHLIASVEELGQAVLYSIDVGSGAPKRLTASGEVTDFFVARDQIVFGLQGLAGPADLYSIPLKGGAPRRLTDANHELLAARGMSEFEQFSFKGWNDETVYGYVMKPYGFAAERRFPVAFLVHGGPQGSFGNTWSYSLNAQTLSGHGYGVVAIDFHGSTGYGQAFTDSISGDWSDKPLVDLQKGLAAALKRYPWLDGERVCALGGSYGAYMINWIEGNWPDRFRCMVSHDGIFDQRMWYYATEELWFPEWDIGGGPQCSNPAAYERVNPLDYVAKWRTPMLVVHGELDYRNPVSQGLGVFTALQGRGIESKLLVFPSEGHRVLKPADSMQWYHTVLEWLDTHLKKMDLTH